MIITLSLGFIYFLLGVVLSFSVGMAVAGLISFFKSLFKLFKCKTAWVLSLTSLIITYSGVSFAFGFLSLAGNIGDQTNYKMQSLLFVSALIPGLFTWIYSIMFMLEASTKLLEKDTYESYTALWAFLVFYAFGLLGALIIFNYFLYHFGFGWFFVSVILYPVTFVFAPIYLLFTDAIWLPLVLHYGGLFLGGFLISLSPYD